MKLQSTRLKSRFNAALPALFFGLSGMALADTGEILSPGLDEVVYKNYLILEASDPDAAGNNVQWAVRYETCAANTGTVAGNVDGFNNDSDWDEEEERPGHFTALVEFDGLDAGQYCFVFNTQQGSASGSRLTQEFYLVDEFAKVGGTIGMGKGMGKGKGKGMGMGKAGRGNSPTHSFDGVVGIAGEQGVVGSITINYRELGEIVTFTPANFFLRDDPPAVLDDTSQAVIDTVSGARIFVMDRDAVIFNEYADDFPRGGIVVRNEGEPSINDYEIDGSPGQTGFDSWVPMERGNNHTGIRGQ